MQILSHKNPGLTICQRLFIEKSLELLYIGSIDSYRVRLNNPKTILEELKYCLEEFSIGRIKHFHTIMDSKRNAIVNEALALLDNTPDYLLYKSISKPYLLQLLKSLTENNYKRTISALDILLNENTGYISHVLKGLTELIDSGNTTLNEMEKIDISLNILFSGLISKGFSKGFLYRQVYGIFVNSLSVDNNFNDHFANFRNKILREPGNYSVIFRIDTTAKVYDAITGIQNPSLSLSDDLNNLHITGRSGKEMVQFNNPILGRKFIKCQVRSADYLAALKKARSILSEYLDVLNLGLSDEYLFIHSRALVIDQRSPDKAEFQNNVNILDGKYRVEKDHYLEFTKKVPSILNDPSVSTDTKEKIKSAIRYLRLGNQSTEVEHKFINYWIGLEYLFSNYESQNTINRIKDHFINAHALAYVKRNTYSFKKDFEQLSHHDKAKVASYTSNDYSCLSLQTFYSETASGLLNSHVLLAYRALKLEKWFFKAGKAANASDYIKKHKLNLEVHFTRIYRLRNEIIHDAATNTNNEHIASNMRYYLTFILNELIDFLAKADGKSNTIEDYFLWNEIEIGNIELGGYLLEQLLQIDCSLEFIS